MNIFATDENPCIAANWLDDKRQNKMIIECAQMLSTALRIVTDNDSEICKDLYKISHPNHGCNRWIRESRSNFGWLVSHGACLANGYVGRSGRRHKSMDVLYRCAWYMDRIPDGPLQPFSNHARSKALSIDFTHIEDTCSAYRQYLIERWKNDKVMPKWTGDARACPDWAREALREVYGEKAIPDLVIYE